MKRKWVKPVLDKVRMSMTVKQAEHIARHPKRKLIPPELVAEADEVLAKGRHYRPL